MIHLTSLSDIYSSKYCWIWFLSAFKAGFLNSAGFLVTGNFVSHVTGFGTQIGMALGNRAYFFGVELLIIPISFILGGVVTSYVLRKNNNGNIPPAYHLIQALITSLIGLVIFMGESGLVNFKGNNSQEPYGIYELLFISLLCLICGLKNSLITLSTNGKIRVTHLTGLATDIGLNVVHTLSKSRDEKNLHEKKVNSIRMMTFAFFSIGACISAVVYPLLGYKAFGFVMLISLLMTFVSLKDRRQYIERSNGYLGEGVQSGEV